MIKQIFYVPNLLNYARLVLLIIVILIIPKYPLKAFLINLLAGNLDMIDGIYARSFDQRSKFGAFLDHSMDRLSTSIILVYLAVRYKQFWFVFLSIQFVELIMDFLMGSLNNYRSTINFLKINSISNNSQMAIAFRIEMNRHLMDKKVSDEKSKTNVYSDFYNFLIQFIWYSGDTFYWILYSYLFMGEKNVKVYKKSEIIFLYKFYLESFFEKFLNLIRKHTAYFFQLEKRYVFLRWTFFLFFHVCLLGAFLKFYLNLVNIFRVLRDVLLIENQI